MEGRDALQKGDYNVACAKLQSSLDASGALGPLLNLADCEEKRGRLATSLALWRQGQARLAKKPDDERLPVARQHIADLDKRVPTLLLVLAPKAPSNTSVMVDGKRIERFETPTPLDPGSHDVVASAEGRENEVATVELAVGERRTLTVGSWAQGSEAPSSGASGKKIAGFVLGGVGVAGLVMFGVTGGLMVGQKNVVDEHCNEQSRKCDMEGAEAAKQGRTLGIVNGITLGAGLAGVAVGVVLIATSGSGEKKAASLRITPVQGGSMVTVGGQF